MSIKKKIKKYRIDGLSPNTDSTNNSSNKSLEELITIAISMRNEINHAIKNSPIISLIKIYN